MFSAKRILSPIDFSDFSIQALEVAEDIAARYGSELLLVHVVPVIPKLEGHANIFTEGEYENQLIASAKQRLADMAAKLQQQGVHARSTVSLSNDPAMEIMRVAESEKVRPHRHRHPRHHRLAPSRLRLSHRQTRAHRRVLGAGPAQRSGGIRRFGVRALLRNALNPTRWRNAIARFAVRTRCSTRLAHPAAHRVQHF